MARIEFIESEALQFAAIIAAAWVVMWWGVRPLSFVYQRKHGRISVRTFFFLPMATVTLSEISRVEAVRPPEGKPLRWLVSPFRRWSGRTIFAGTAREWVVLPDWLAGELAARPSEGSGDDRACSQYRGDSGYQRRLAGLMISNRAARKLASWCVPLAGAAAWCLILLPLWLTAVELVGFKVFADEVGIPWTRVLDRGTWSHFGASAFLVACGIAARGMLAFRMSLPLPLAGISVFAACGRLSLAFPGSHDIISHRLFDSCTGYDERHAIVGISCLIASLVIAMAAWDPDGKQAQVFGVAGLAGTP